MHRQHRAGLDRLAVEQHRAGAAVRGVATDVGAGQAQHLAQEMDQQQARLHLGLALGALHLDPDLVLCHGYCSFARWMARRSARAVRTRDISRLYSIVPRRSALCLAAAPASRAVSAITAAVGCLPVRYRSASTARSGTGPALVKAMPALATSPPLPSVTCTAAAAAAKSPTLG